MSDKISDACAKVESVLADSGFGDAKAQKARLEAEVSQLGATLNQFPKGGLMGMTPENIRTSPEYRSAKANYDRAFQKLRDFNQTYVKQFKSEIRESRR